MVAGGIFGALLGQKKAGSLRPADLSGFRFVD